MSDMFEHRALELEGDMPLIYTAMSKHLFFMREHISRHVLENGGVPINPFMVFNYFLGDSVDRDVVRRANNSLVASAEQIWVYGPVSDGVLAEVVQAKEQNKLVRYFGIVASREIIESTSQQVELEDEVKDKRTLL